MVLGTTGTASATVTSRGPLSPAALAAALQRHSFPTTNLGYAVSFNPAQAPRRAGDVWQLTAQVPALAPEPPSLYAAACRRTHPGESWRFQTWNHALALGQPLPTLPLWLRCGICLPVELEATYERTCVEQRVQPAAYPKLHLP